MPIAPDNSLPYTWDTDAIQLGFLFNSLVAIAESKVLIVAAASSCQSHADVNVVATYFLDLIGQSGYATCFDHLVLAAPEYVSCAPVISNPLSLKSFVDAIVFTAVAPDARKHYEDAQ